MDTLKFQQRKLVKNNYDSDTQLVRIGVIGDGSCFFHSVLSAFENFSSLKKSKISEIVDSIRKKLSNDLTQDHFKKSMVAVHCFIFILEKYLSANGKNKNEKLWRQIIDKRDIYNYNSLREYADELFLNNLDITEVIEYQTIMKRLQDKSFEVYKKKLSDSSVYVGLDNEDSVDAIQFFSEKIEHNIFIISGDTKKPYIGLDCKNIDLTLPSIFIISIDNIHYELLGRLEKDEEDNAVTTTFAPGDPFVIKTYNILCK